MGNTAAKPYFLPSEEGQIDDTKGHTLPKFDFESRLNPAFRPSHTTTETAKKVVIVHAHYNCNDFLTVFYMENNFYKDFSQKDLCENLSSVRGPLGKQSRQPNCDT